MVIQYHLAPRDRQFLEPSTLGTITGWCSTPTLLLICSSFSRENGHLFLICSSLSTAQIKFEIIVWREVEPLINASSFFGAISIYKTLYRCDMKLKPLRLSQIKMGKKNPSFPFPANVRISRDPPMEGWKNLYDAGVFWSSKWRQAFEGSEYLGYHTEDDTMKSPSICGRNIPRNLNAWRSIRMKLRFWSSPIR